MKIILVNGSPKQYGCTYTALKELSDTLEHESFETQIFQIGNKPLSGCIDCRYCKGKGNGRCVFDDKVNTFLDEASEADGFIFGSPVHYAALAGGITSFMDRVFFAGSADKKGLFRLKPAAGVVSARRGGTTAAFDQFNKYFTISEMPVISSQYWNMVHGVSPEDVKHDIEGLQIMRTLARNMAWFLKCKEAGLKAGITFPQKEVVHTTNFIQ